MKVTTKQVTEVRISEIKPGDGEFGSLDPITVTLKNYRPGVGEITIKCFQEVWTAGWGAMSGQSVQEFFVESDDAYLIGNLARGISDRQRDESPAWDEVFLAQLEENAGGLDEDEQQELRDYIEGHSHLLDPQENEEARQKLEQINPHMSWMDLWPKEPNPDYIYLKRIVQAVQAGLKLWMSERDTISSSSEVD